jgi:hypothetical protein
MEIKYPSGNVYRLSGKPRLVWVGVKLIWVVGLMFNG